MAVLRRALLWASQNAWLRERALRSRAARRAVSRFMPGETVDEALAAARGLGRDRLGTILTLLGENVTSPREADEVRDHYLDVLDRVRALGLDALISVKLTQLGLDLDTGRCEAHLRALVAHAGPDRFVWVDMEGSSYTDTTLALYRRVRGDHRNVGLCLQAYLRRTAADLDALLPLAPAIRLVKGAYREPPRLAFQRKAEVDARYLDLAVRLLSTDALAAGVFPAIATHDGRLIRRIQAHVASMGVPAEAFEFELLYGIQRQEQLRLARERQRVRVLISYGSHWFPWYMRRLAERPANLLFAARQIFG